MVLGQPCVHVWARRPPATQNLTKTFLDFYRTLMSNSLIICRKCNTNFARRRHLCAPCYAKDGINYPCVKPVPVLEPIKLAQVPTDAHPNTPEKLDVLCRRYENRETLWHPQDVRGPRVTTNGINQTATERQILRRAWCSVPAGYGDD